MLLTIHNANLQKVAFVDNEKQSTLNYYDDTWTRNLETGSSTFEFTVFKKAIKSDTASQKTYHYLNEKAFVSFKYHGKSYVFSVMTVEENEKTIKCYCENLNLELINEYANPYKAPRAMTFKEYCDAMDLLNFTHLSIGINEISDQKRKLEWDGQDTKLARLLSLSNKFDAEVDFETTLNADSSIKSFKVNVYHEHDDDHQGVGRVRDDIQLTYGKNLKSITRKIDKTGIYNAVRPTGKRKTNGADGNEIETVVTIGSLGEWSENNSDGVREFYQKGDFLYAPLSMQMYPSTFTSETDNDQWIRKDIEVESDNQKVIRASAIRELKKNAYPALTYEVDGFIDVEIGDTVRINDNGFTPILLIKARATDQKISFTNPKSNKTTFSNFKALKNNLSDDIQSSFERLFEATKPYTIKLATDNGVIFKNHIGESLITPKLYKGGKPVIANVTWRWSLDGQVTTGMTYLVRGSSVTNAATLTVAAYIGNDEVAIDEISFVNVVDGKVGTQGIPGRDGRTPYVHTAWSNNATGTDGFSLISSTNKQYIGIYTDFEPNDSTDPKKYKWAKIKGDKGDKGDTGQRGLDGLQGERGERGIPGANGADGRTQYTHIAYADNATGGGFSQTDSRKSYIGIYVDFNLSDSNNPTKYRWSKWKGEDGAQGIPGAKGADGRTPYFHRAWSNSADGRVDFSTHNSNDKRYLGTLTDFNETDSQNPADYQWTALFGNVKVGSRNLIKGTKDLTGNDNQSYTTTDNYLGFKVARSHPSSGYADTFRARTTIDSIGEEYISTFYAKSSVDGFEVDCHFWSPNNTTFAESSTGDISHSSDGRVKVRLTTEWQRYWVRWTHTPTNNQKYFLVGRNFATTSKGSASVEVAGVALYEGNVPKDWTPAPEDIEKIIDSKADNDLTQEQLNALNEKAGILKAELEAKASVETINEWMAAYQKFLKANALEKAQAERDLIIATQRVVKLENNLKDMSERWNFIDTYMSVQNEGLVVGKNDGSSSAVFSDDRISFISAGKEVAYFSSGALQVDNGVFTKTIQIGRFREEQYHLNPDMNVIRYVGG